MLLKPILKRHYGTMVWTNPTTDIMRRSECLCLNCDKLKICPTSKQLYDICETGDMAMMITRCKSYEKYIKSFPPYMDYDIATRKDEK